MKIRFLIFIVAMICSAGAAVFADSANRVQEQEFFESPSDIPLMPGLYEVPDELVVFDKPGGRIIESVAASKALAGGEIRAFYNQVLPQMGWSKSGPNAFIRQDELLIMKIETQDDLSIIRFMVSPRQ